MDKFNILFFLILLYNCQLFAQDSLTAKKELVINEILRPIDKSNLFLGWKNFTSDTIKPTSLIQDLNGDGKLDSAWFYTGMRNGLSIFGNINKKDGDIEELFDLPFDSAWYNDEGVFPAVMELVKSGKKIKNIETGSWDILKHNSVGIFKEDGFQFIVTFKENDWKIIKVK